MCLEEDSENEYSFLRTDQTFPDNAIKRELKKFHAHCTYEGCYWDGPFPEYEKHEKECVLKKIKCDACEEEITEQDRETHRLECEVLMTDNGLRKNVVKIKKKLTTLEELVMRRDVETAGSDSRAAPLSDPISQQFEALKMQVAAHEEALKAYQDMFVVMSREVERNTNLIAETNNQLKSLTQFKEDAEQQIQTMGVISLLRILINGPDRPG